MDSYPSSKAISLANVTKLNRDTDYPLFREEIEQAARQLKVWDYIDEDGILDIEEADPGDFPTAPMRPNVPQQPEIPPVPVLIGLSGDMDQNQHDAAMATNTTLEANWRIEKARALAELDEWQQQVKATTVAFTLQIQVYNLDRDSYNHRKKLYDQKQRDLMIFNTQMGALIGTPYSEILKQDLTTRGRLIRLRDRINPQGQDEQQRVEEEFESLMSKAPKDWFDWTFSVERVFDRGQRIRCDGITDPRCKRLFLKTIRTSHPHHHDTELFYESVTIAQGAIITFIDALKRFRIYAKTAIAKPQYQRQVNNLDVGQQQQQHDQSPPTRMEKILCKACGYRHQMPTKDRWYEACWSYWGVRKPELQPSTSHMPSRARAAIEHWIRQNKKSKEFEAAEAYSPKPHQIAHWKRTTEFQKGRPEGHIRPDPVTSQQPPTKAANVEIQGDKPVTNSVNSVSFDDRPSNPKILNSISIANNVGSIVENLKDCIILDTGASAHVCNNRNAMVDVRETDEVLYAGGIEIKPEGRGTLIVNTHCEGFSDGRDLTFKDVFLVPQLHTNIVAFREFKRASILWDHELDILFMRGSKQQICSVRDEFGQYVIARLTALREKSTHLINPIILATQKRSRQTTKIASYGATDPEAQRLHERLGHPGPEPFRQVVSKMGEAFEHLQDQGPRPHECETCATSKAVRDISRKAPTKVPYGPARAFSLDLHYEKPSYEGYEYYPLFTCMTTGMRFLFPLREKRELPFTTIQFIRWVHRQFAIQVMMLWLDNESSIVSSQEMDLIRQEGVEVRLSAPRTPTQNGHAESSAFITKRMIRTLFQQSHLPHEMWKEVALTACYLLNRLERKYRDTGSWASPYERWWAWMRDNTIEWSRLPTNLKPEIEHLRVYGCVAYPMTSQALEKAQGKAMPSNNPRAHIGYLVGYKSTSQWVIWVPSLRRTVVTANVQFDERYSYDEKREENAAIAAPYTYEYLRQTGGISLGYEDDAEDQDDLNLVGIALPLDLANLQLDQSQVHHDLQLPLSYRESHTTQTPDEMLIDGPEIDQEHQTDLSVPVTAPQQPLTSTQMTLWQPRHIKEATDLFSTEIEPFKAIQEDIIDHGGVDPQHLEGGHHLLEAPPDQPHPIDDGGDQPQQNLLAAPPPPIVGGDDYIAEQLFRRSTRKKRETAKKRESHDIMGRSRQPATPRGAKRSRHNSLDENLTSTIRPPKHQRLINHIIANATTHNQRIESMPAPPETFQQAIHSIYSEQWWKAMIVEINELERVRSYKVIDQEATNGQIIPLKWVFTYKADENGYLVRFKARLTVRGDLQTKSQEEDYAATLAAQTFRILMALCTVNDWNTRQYDIKNAFVSAFLDEEVFCQMPQGFSQRGKALKLLRALYGLRRAPRLWYDHLSQILTSQGFEQVAEDACVFIKEGIYILFFVDDIIMLYPTERSNEANEFDATLKSKLNVTDLGEVRWFLGIEIIRNRGKKQMWLSQRSYLEIRANKYGLDDASTDWKPLTPMPAAELVPHNGTATPNEIKLFQSLVGTLIYLSIITRPDEAFAASKLAQFLTNPSPLHIRVARQALRYGYNHRDLCVFFTAEEAYDTLYATSDASHGDDTASRKSSQGWVFLLYGGPIVWKATKQPTVATSSTEAELTALCTMVRERIALGRLMEQLGLQLPNKIIVYCDNRQTIGLIMKTDQTLSTNLRHVDIRRHWLREQRKLGNLEIQWVPTAEMPADGLTKALTSQSHDRFVKLLNLKLRPDSMDQGDQIRSKPGGCYPQHQINGLVAYL